MLEEIEFHRLAKLRLEVDEPEELYVFNFSHICRTCESNFELEMNREDYGRLFAYDKSYDRVTTKTERLLQPLDRMKYNPTTSDDPVIQQVGTSSEPLA